MLYKLVFSLVASGIFCSSVVASDDCSLDYLQHSENVLNKVTNSDVTMQALGAAQRDCLAIELQRLDIGDNLCPTFRRFEQDFLVLNSSMQIIKGKQCTLQLIDKLNPKFNKV